MGSGDTAFILISTQQSGKRNNLALKLKMSEAMS